MDMLKNSMIRYLRPTQVGPLASGVSAFVSKEMAFDENLDTIWMPDVGNGYSLVQLVERGENKVIVKMKNKKGAFEQKSMAITETQEVNPTVFELCEDMASLTHLNEASVLHNLRQRFLLDLIHTFSGLFCVTINPWRWLPIYTEPIVQMYTAEGCEHPPPHVFAIAQTAYTGIIDGGGDQSILITGESGAGKTENTKKIIQYFTMVANGNGKRRNIQANDSLCNNLEEQILEMNPVIEAFGNAKTTQNDNSSRFGKFIRIKFDEHNNVKSAEVQSYLLEKSRVVSQNRGERNFHIFYQLLSEGMPVSVKQSLKLTKSTSSYRFLNQGESTQVDSINDTVEAQHTERGLGILGFSQEEKLGLYQLIAVCVLIGELKFTERTGFDQTFINGTDEANDICRLLGLKPNKFVAGLTEPTIKIGDQLIRKTQNLEKTLFSAAAVAKSIYERVFFWIVGKCNQSLRAKESKKQSFADGSESLSNGHDSRHDRFIGVLDMAGFEIISVNSFEQLCINYTNERLQQFFNHYMFVKEQTEYENEEIQWDYIDFGFDLQPTIDLIEKPLGIFSLLEEECVVPKGNDDSLAEKLCQMHLGKSTAFGRPRPSIHQRGIAHFSICHYAGVVSYNVDHWLEKNRDPLAESLLEMLAGATHPLLSRLFHNDAPSFGPKRRQSLASLTLSNLYKEQLSSLVSTLNDTTPHFIRCIVPNYERKPGLIDGPLVLQQLRCNGVLEGIRICRRGYPNRLLFEEFVDRYKLLDSNSSPDRTSNHRRMVEQLCINIELKPFAHYQLGVTKIFCRVGTIGQLESRRNDKLAKLICGLQAQIRWYLTMIDYDQRNAEWESTMSIQRAVRNFSSIHQWRWFKLIQLVMPMVSKQKERKQIDDLKAERDELRKMVEKLEKEGDNLKGKIRSLEKQVDEALRINRKQDNQLVIMHEEMKRQDDLLAALQCNLVNQKDQLMNLQSTLNDEHSCIQELRNGKSMLEDDLASMKSSLEREKKIRERIEANQVETINQLKGMKNALKQSHQVKEDFEMNIRMHEKESKELKMKISDNLKKNKILQQQISDQTTRVSQNESQLHTEKMTKKKLEAENEQMEEKLKELQRKLEKSQEKAESLKEQYCGKETEIGRLNKKLADSNDKLDFCISDMKKRHAATHKQQQDQMEEYRKKYLKLDSENKQLKSRVDHMEREAMLESTADFSSSSSRLVGRRHTTHGTLLANRRSQSQMDALGLQSFYCVKRNVKNESNKDMVGRRLEDMEKELRTLETDKRLLKRELEIYKRTVQDEAMEKDALSKQVKGLVSDVDQLNKTVINEEERAGNLDRKLRMAQGNLVHWKAKCEDMAMEKDSEISKERRRMQLKLDEVVHERKLTHTQVTLVNKSREELQLELADTQTELDRAYVTVTQLEKLHKSQGKAVETWGSQYRIASGELEALREENASLRSRVRRQQREMDSMRETTVSGNESNGLENKIRRLREELLLSSSTSEHEMSPSVCTKHSIISKTHD